MNINFKQQANYICDKLCGFGDWEIADRDSVALTLQGIYESGRKSVIEEMKLDQPTTEEK